MNTNDPLLSLPECPPIPVTSETPPCETCGAPAAVDTMLPIRNGRARMTFMDYNRGCREHYVETPIHESFVIQSALTYAGWESAPGVPGLLNATMKGIVDDVAAARATTPSGDA